MRRLVVIIAWITWLPTSLLAQGYKPDEPIESPALQYPDAPQIFRLNEPDQLISEFEDYLKLNHKKLVIQSLKTSPVGSVHVLFQIECQGIEIDYALIKANFNADGSLKHVILPKNYRELQNTSTPELQHHNLEAVVVQDLSDLKISKKWVLKNGKLWPGVLIEGIDAHGEHIAVLQSTNGIEYREQRSSNHHHRQASDTTIAGYVFLPDPLTTAGESYGGSYVDNNDQTNAFLDAQRFWVETLGSFEQDTFRLKNRFVQIHEHSLPVGPIEFSTDSNFAYHRTHFGFEQLMIVYHITEMAEYLEKMGYLEVDYSIRADPHALGGNDNSSFSAFISPPVLNFGTGGVDDAEDADVIIHEYGHAVSHGIAPGTNFGLQRKTIDEGFCDYLAAAYSNDVTGSNNNLIYNWDGHNEFWSGRSVATFETYPWDLQNNIYEDADLWSSALMEMNRLFGREVADSIIFHSMYNYFGGMSLSQAAFLLTEAELLLYNGKYQNQLCDLLNKKGLLAECAVVSSTLSNLPEAAPEDFTIQRSGKVLQLESSFIMTTATIYNLQGQVLFTQKPKSNQVIWYPNLEQQTVLVTVTFHSGKRKTHKFYIP